MVRWNEADDELDEMDETHYLCTNMISIGPDANKELKQAHLKKTNYTCMSNISRLVSTFIPHLFGKHPPILAGREQVTMVIFIVGLCRRPNRWQRPKYIENKVNYSRRTATIGRTQKGETVRWMHKQNVS